MGAVSAARTVLELGQNALAAGAGALAVRVAHTGAGWQLAVLDDGPGIPAAVLAGAYPAGHGLALVQAGGRLALRNVPGGALALAALPAGAPAGDLAGAAAALCQHESAPAVALWITGPRGEWRMALPVGPGAGQACAARDAVRRGLEQTGIPPQ